MNIPGKPIYTPESLIKKGLFTAGKLLMQLFMKKNRKPSQEQQRRGGNAQGQAQVLIKHKNQPDGTTRAEQIPVETIVPDVNKILNNPDYMDAIEFQEYIGPYHSYPNGAIYSGAEYSDESVQLMPYTSLIDPAHRYDDWVPKNRFSKPTPMEEDNNKPIRSENNTLYFKLTKRRFDLHTEPQPHFPQPDERDYNRGFIKRYFVQRINDKTHVTEVSRDEFARINKNNTPGIDRGLYRGKMIEWTISGPKEEVRKANERVIIEASHRLSGILNFLTDYDELHKSKEREFIPIEEMIRTESDGNPSERQYPDGSAIHSYLPVSYAPPNPALGAFASQCGNCYFRQNNVCAKWNADIRNNYWCKSWRSSEGLPSPPVLDRAGQLANQDIEQLRVEQERQRRENARRESEEMARRNELLRRAEESGENSIVQPPEDEGTQQLPDVFNPPAPSPPYPPPPSLQIEESDYDYD